MAQSVHRDRPTVSALVEAWLGLSRPVAGDAIERARFAPDPFESYCARCGESTGPGEAMPDGCGECRRKPAIADRVIRLGRYDPPLKEWISAIKYEGWTEMGEVLGALLAQRIAASRSIEPAKTIVVPVPMPWQRRLYRGIDHARLIAEGASRHLHLRLFPILTKRNGEPQVAVAAATDRRHSRKDWIRIRRRIGGWPLDGLHVILVDDVTTTGTTLRTCAKLLRSLGAERIIAAVLAVTDSPSRRGRSTEPTPPLPSASRDDSSIIAPE
jgi:ComF family protein